MSDRLATDSIRKALRARFCAPEWATFFEVHQGTGATNGRSADCVAMNLFPSRGLRVHGIEIKASRNDWMRELRDPTKAEPVMRFCDHWWIAARSGVVLAGELPPTWGLLELCGSVLRQKVAAPKLKAETMTRPFIAAMFRRASEKAHRELKAACDEKLEVERSRVEERINAEVSRRTYDHATLKKTVEEFEAASGLKLPVWGGGKELGAAVALTQKLGVTASYQGLRALAARARQFADQADELLPTPTEQSLALVEEAA